MQYHVSFPAPGRIHIQSEALFRNPTSDVCVEFARRVMGSPGVLHLSIHGLSEGKWQPDRPGQYSALAEVQYCVKTLTRRQAVEQICNRLLSGSNGNFCYNTDSRDTVVAGPAPKNRAKRSRTAGKNPAAKGQDVAASAGAARSELLPSAVGAAPHAPGYPQDLPLFRDKVGVVRLYRHGPLVTSWDVKHELPGRIRLSHPVLFRAKEMCQAVERELMSVIGIDTYKASPVTGTVLVAYQPKHLRREQLLEILDSAVKNATDTVKRDKADLMFPLCTVSLPLAAAAQLAVPALLPVSVALLAYTATPSFKSAYTVLRKERRMGVDLLDSLVIGGCLASGSVVAGSIVCWCLGLGRYLYQKTQDDSKKMLMSVFGKAPRFVWLYREGVEIETPLDKLQKGDVIVVKTGEVVPVDGVVSEGMAVIDQHSLTGESTPAEKGVGDRVFASTLMVAGKVLVQVESSGGDTTSAKIGKILSDSAGYKLMSQNRGERLADKAVIPTMALAATAFVTVGPAGGVAVLNSEFGTGIRMAVPLAMLTSLTECAHKGILVKDGRALELMNDIDTVLFDKTGTLTREQPDVGRIIACAGYDSATVLRFAAAAENKFAHPIAKAILEKFKETGLPLPACDDSKYRVGYGITVGIAGKLVRVGSARFMKSEGIELPRVAAEALEQAHLQGHTIVFVSADDRLAGAIELRVSPRPEAREIIAGLRQRGIKHIAIISGDHEAPTRKLAGELGMDEYFAGVLPADKASYVERLQQQGRKVCFVGDGINDSIALKKANVSVSLRGASSIATDTAHIVFMEESLSKLCELRDIADRLNRNVSRSWTLILVPNLLCMGGAFTMGFGLMTSVFTNNVSALAALANGMLPLRQIQRHKLARSQKVHAATDACVLDIPSTPVPPKPVTRKRRIRNVEKTPSTVRR